MIPTFKNVDHASKTITGATVNTVHHGVGSSENVELILTQIYKEICAKESSININVPDIILPPLAVPSITVPETNVTVKHETQPVIVEIKAQITLIAINTVISTMALIAALYAVFK